VFEFTISSNRQKRNAKFLLELEIPFLEKPEVDFFGNVGIARVDNSEIRFQSRYMVLFPSWREILSGTFSIMHTFFKITKITLKRKSFYNFFFGVNKC